MNLHLSDWEWLRVVTSLLFIWRGIQDLRDRSGTVWKTEDERKNFRKFSGVTFAGHRTVEYHSAGSGISGLHRFCHLQPVLPRQPGRQG